MKAFIRHIAFLSKRQMCALLIFAGIAIFHQFIANDKYIVAKTKSGIEFFADKGSSQYGLPSPIPYSASFMDRNNRSVGPFDKQDVSGLYHRHWLGTDSLGRDVLAGLIYGSYVAFQVGLLTVLASTVIGIFFAFWSAYYGDDGLRIDRSKIIWLLIFSGVLIFYMIYSELWIAITLSLVLIAVWTLIVRNSSRDRTKTLALPLDLLVMKLIEVINSIPGLFLILVLLSMFVKPSIWNVILVLVILRWPVITRHMRAEILKIKEEDYIMSAKSIGQSDLRIFLYHIIPMTISPIIIVSSFGFATAILLESTLSFLGIGLAVDQQTWGSIIKQARFDLSAWWLALFPGMAIYLIVILFNAVGDELNKKLRAD